MALMVAEVEVMAAAAAGLPTEGSVSFFFLKRKK